MICIIGKWVFRKRRPGKRRPKTEDPENEDQKRRPKIQELLAKARNSLVLVLTGA